MKGISYSKNSIKLLFAVVCLSGCSPQVPPESHPSAPGLYVNTNRVVSIDELADSDPVLYVNGKKISRRDFETYVVFLDRVWRIAEKVPLDVTDEEMADFREKAGPGAILQLIHHELFRQYAEEIGVVPTEDKVRVAAEQLLSGLGRPKSTVEKLAAEIGGDAGALFRRIPYIDAQDAMLRQSVTTNDLDNVSEAEIKEREEFVAKFDDNAEKLNKKAIARLKEAKARILAGADFEAEAKSIKDAVNPKFGKLWGKFEIQEFPADEDLHKWLVGAKVGDISDPLDLDDGIAIVKVLAKGKGEAPPGVEPPDAYTLARCTVQAFEKMRYQDREQMKRQLLLWKREEAQRALGTMLSDRAVIEYPNGTNLFDKVAVEAKGEKQK